jgi:hypothetical protein
MSIEQEVTVPNAPVVRVPQRAWTDAFARVPGHKERRQARRAEQRKAAKAVKVANRRRVRSHRAAIMAATTLRQQVRIFDGQIGTERQRARVAAQFTRQAQELGQDRDQFVAALRSGLDLVG